MSNISNLRREKVSLGNSHVQATGMVSANDSESAASNRVDVSQAAGAVTANGNRGVLTFTGLTTASGAQSADYVFTNDKIAADSIILMSCGSETTGTPVVSVKERAAGSCTITITNVDDTDALAGDVDIHYMIL